METTAKGFLAIGAITIAASGGAILGYSHGVTQERNAHRPAPAATSTTTTVGHPQPAPGAPVPQVTLPGSRSQGTRAVLPGPPTSTQRTLTTFPAGADNSPYVYVPNLRGMTWGQATSTLTAAGLKLLPVGTEIPGQHVIAQSPQAGYQVTTGSSVEVSAR